MTWCRLAALIVTGVLVGAWPAAADDPKPAKPAPTDAAANNTAAAQQPDDPDLDINPAQPDFTIINLSTTLRVPRHKSAFRVTHRFGRPLGSGDFSDLIQDLFGLDSGAQIGLEYRFGLFRGTQIGINRTNERTIEFFALYDLIHQDADSPTGLAVIATIDGTNNFRDSYTPGIGVVIGHTFGDIGAVYAQPMFLNNTNDVPSELAEDNDTFLLGLGARVRIRPTVYVVAEVTPRAGFAPGATLGSFGFEKRWGGHIFQLNFSNGFGTLPSQIARGGTGSDDWYIGFNISRKFF